MNDEPTDYQSYLISRLTNHYQSRANQLAVTGNFLTAVKDKVLITVTGDILIAVTGNVIAVR